MSAALTRGCRVVVVVVVAVGGLQRGWRWHTASSSSGSSSFRPPPKGMSLLFNSCRHCHRLTPKKQQQQQQQHQPQLPTATATAERRQGLCWRRPTTTALCLRLLPTLRRKQTSRQQLGTTCRQTTKARTKVPAMAMVLLKSRLLSVVVGSVVPTTAPGLRACLRSTLPSFSTKPLNRCPRRRLSLSTAPPPTSFSTRRRETRQLLLCHRPLN